MLKNFEASMRYYERALVLLTEVGDQHGVIDVWNGMGCTALDTHEHENALRCLQQSLSLARQVQDDDMVASIHGNMGYVAMQQQAWDTADEHMQECLRIHQKRRSSLAWPLQNLAELAQARALYEESLAMYRSNGETYRIAEVLESLSIVIEHCGEQDAARLCRAEGQHLSIQLRGA